MSIPEAEKYFRTVFGDRGIHLSSTDHGLTACIQRTDISRREITDLLNLLATNFNVYHTGTWEDEFFFTDNQQS